MDKSICFVSRHAHYVLLGQTQRKIGGAEFQESVIANALADSGWRVSFITEKNEDGLVGGKNRITLFPVLNYNKGNRITRRLVHLPFQLWKAMRRANAQVYYQRNPGAFSSLIGLFCRILKRRFILAAASDANFDRRNELNVSSQIDVLDIRWGVRLAHTILLQNERQQYLLESHYRRKGHVFYNLYEPPPSYAETQPPPSSNKKPSLLWIGRLSREKRPQLCIDLANLLPDFEIILVGAQERSTNRQPPVNVAEFARFTENLTCLGHISLDKVERLFDSAQGLINTSSTEGFPNTFLQAWSRGLPVFSFADPDNLIATHRLGVSVSSIEEMAAAIRKKLSDAESFTREAQQIRSFFHAHFCASRRIHDLEALLLSDG